MLAVGSHEGYRNLAVPGRAGRQHIHLRPKMEEICPAYSYVQYAARRQCKEQEVGQACSQHAADGDDEPWQHSFGAKESMGRPTPEEGQILQPKGVDRGGQHALWGRARCAILFSLARQVLRRLPGTQLAGEWRWAPRSVRRTLWQLSTASSRSPVAGAT